MHRQRNTIVTYQVKILGLLVLFCAGLTACGAEKSRGPDTDENKIDPIVETLEAREINTHSATLRGNLSVKGNPKPNKIGFCYHTESTTPDHENGATCIDTALPTAPGEYDLAIDNTLEPGTTYTVRAFAQTAATDQESSRFIYASPITFATRTLAPENVTATAAAAVVQVRWDEVFGTSKYQIFRNDRLIETVASTQNHFDDPDVSADSVPQPPTLEADDTLDGVQLSWNQPDALPDPQNIYKIIALNAFELESAPSNDAPLTLAFDFELQADDGDGQGFVLLETLPADSSKQTQIWLDTTAPAGSIDLDNVNQTITATLGTHPDYVHLSSESADIQPAAPRTYRVRARGALGNSEFSNQATGQRLLGALSYQWERSESGADVFAAITDCEENNLICDDTSASESGDVYDYRLSIDAPGVETQFSDTVQGARAIIVGRFDTQPSFVQINTNFEAAVTLTNQFGAGIEGIDVTMALQRVGDAAFRRPVGEKKTDANGRAPFSATVDQIGADYRLEATVSPDKIITSELFRVTDHALLVVSADAAGVAGDSDSALPKLSADGRFVAFASHASNIVPGVPDDTMRIYRKSLVDQSILPVSTSATGVPANNEATKQSISADGRYVAFESAATNLVSNAGDVRYRIYRKDLENGAIVVVSANAAGELGNADSHTPSISADGRYVAFISTATNLLPNDTNDALQVYRKDLVTGEVVLVSTRKNGVLANKDNIEPSISADGRYVAFQSYASNLVDEVASNGWHIYSKDLVTEDIMLASANANGDPGTYPAFEPAISGNGRFVIFLSKAANLVASEDSEQDFIYRKDLVDGSVALVCSNAAGQACDQPNRAQGYPAISHDGRFVAFRSRATNLLTGMPQNRDQIYRKDMSSGTIVHVNTTGVLADRDSIAPSISGNGHYVAFYTRSTNLIPGSTLNHWQVYVRQIPLD